MATKVKLLCPRCRYDLPGSFGQGEAGVCPKCQTHFDAPKVKAPRQATVILRAQPFRPPPQAATPSFKPFRRTPFVAAAALLVAMIGGFVLWTQAPQTVSEPVAAEFQATAPAPDALAAPKSSQPDEPPQMLTAQSTTNPRARAVSKMDPTPSLPGPLTFSTASKFDSSSIAQEKVDRAIHLGKQYLIASKNRWLNAGAREVGYAALPALALLEAGVPGDDPTIEGAAALVRRKGPQTLETYEIALAILFLDRLGAAADEPLIRHLALRLVAGQTPQYGWDYRCPRLPFELETPLQTMLEKLQPGGRWQAPLAREPGKGLLALAIPVAGNRTAVEVPRETGSMEPASAVNPIKPMALGDADRIRNVVKEFPAALRSLPVVQPMPTSVESKSKGKAKASHQDDNSNTQFALLALWTARRHGIPVDRSLLLADQRFAKSQLGDGSWGYRIGDHASRPSMTSVGLLGLALGHGALLPEGREPDRAPRAGGDPAIQRGLEALGRSIGHPSPRDHAATPNLYFLWSLERVAMMYQLPTIGGKDWYGWGANDLIASQRPDGAWSDSDYHGSAPPLDTAFALLFLRRSNLVPDLTERLHLHMAIADPQRR